MRASKETECVSEPYLNQVCSSIRHGDNYFRIADGAKGKLKLLLQSMR